MIEYDFEASLPQKKIKPILVKKESIKSDSSSDFESSFSDEYDPFFATEEQVKRKKKISKKKKRKNKSDEADIEKSPKKRQKLFPTNLVQSRSN